jgi:hypothetical protein
MSSRVSSVRRIVSDHFEPEEASDPKLQRQLRGHLEAIDYAAYDANRKVMAGAIGAADPQQFQRLGLAAAQARARWLATALAATDRAQTPTPEEIEKLQRLRQTFEELTEAYDALRRLVERGYLTYTAAPSR